LTNSIEPGVREALGRPPRSFDEFARDYASPELADVAKIEVTSEVLEIS
jgi:hypothetical protein